MTSKEIIDAALRYSGYSQANAARKMNTTPQNLSQKLLRNSLRSDELIELLGVIGFTLQIVDNKTGEIVKLESCVNGHGRRARAYSDGKVYDTAQSRALSNSFYCDGVHEYDEKGNAEELYVDKDGMYFIVEYSNEDGKADRIRAVTERRAKDFIEIYGTKIEKV